MFNVMLVTSFLGQFPKRKAISLSVSSWKQLSDFT